jgi:hypothetical protein
MRIIATLFAIACFMGMFNQPPLSQFQISESLNRAIVAFSFFPG